MGRKRGATTSTWPLTDCVRSFKILRRRLDLPTYHRLQHGEHVYLLQRVRRIVH